MSSISPLTCLQAGALSLGVAVGFVACGNETSLGGNAGGTLINDAASDVLPDVFRHDGGSGSCPLVDFNPPAALRFRAYDVRYGGSGTTVPQATMPFGGVYINSDLVLPETADASNAFVGLLQWGSMPFELPSTNDKVRRRVNGDPLAVLDRPGIPNWDDAFPGTQHIGFAYTAEGHIDQSACALSLRLLGAVNQPSGLNTNQPLLALPFYAQRADGRYDMAAADFSNEAVAVFQGGLTLVLNLKTVPGMDPSMESAVLVVCENNCPTVSGSSVRRLEAVLTRRPTNPGASDAGFQDAQAETGTDAAADATHDSGTPTDSGADAGPDGSRDAAHDG